MPMLLLAASLALADEAPCETTWPDATAPTAEETTACIDHWLKTAYGVQTLSPDELELDPSYGHPVERTLTTAQLARMVAHVETQCPPDGGHGVRPCDRAIEYFTGVANERLSLTDRAAWQTFEPVLKKVLDGEALTEADLHHGEGGPAWTPVTLWRLRNAVFARHGRAFTNPDLQRFFYEEGAVADTALLPLKVDPAYADDRLTAIDRANIARIRALER